jgi:hypothetical protein
LFVREHVEVLCASVSSHLTHLSPKLLGHETILVAKRSRSSLFKQLEKLFALSLRGLQMLLTYCFSQLKLIIRELKSPTKS